MRFDPYIQNPSNSQNYNRYTYALNNPLKYIDPSGYHHGPVAKPDDWSSSGNGALYLNTFFTNGMANRYDFSGYNNSINERAGYSTDSNGNWIENTYSYNDGNYYNSVGDVVEFTEVFDNFIDPNSVVLPNNTDLNSINAIDGGYQFYTIDPILSPFLSSSSSEVNLHFISGGKGKGTAGGGVPHGGVMFYTEGGELLQTTGLGSENIIYTVGADNITNFQKSYNTLNPTSSPLTISDAQLLADVYGNSSYTPFVGNGVNGTYVLGSNNAPWYTHAGAALSIMGEGFAAGYAGGRAQMMNRQGWQGLQNHYNMQAGAIGYWTTFYTPKRFQPWW